MDNLDSRLEFFGSLVAATRKPTSHDLIFVPRFVKALRLVWSYIVPLWSGYVT